MGRLIYTNINDTMPLRTIRGSIYIVIGTYISSGFWVRDYIGYLALRLIEENEM